MYLESMRDLLRRAEQAGWVSDCEDQPISASTEIVEATKDIRPGELLIIDLHGWADDDGARLSPTSSGPYLDLANIGATSWPTAAIVLANCRGARAQFFGELSRILRHPAAVAGHFDEAYAGDHAPIEIVKTILAEADGGDYGDAFNAMDRSIYNRDRRRHEAWGADLLMPSAYQS
jgi:hypothetical protein